MHNDFEIGSIDPETADELDWTKHPCRRNCIDGAPPMQCHYIFRLEAYHTMSKACYDCPFNITDCFRKHCIAADGIERSILVVNRQMPGPAIEVYIYIYMYNRKKYRSKVVDIAIKIYPRVEN